MSRRGRSQSSFALPPSVRSSPPQSTRSCKLTTLGCVSLSTQELERIKLVFDKAAGCDASASILFSEVVESSGAVRHPATHIELGWWRLRC